MGATNKKGKSIVQFFNGVNSNAYEKPILVLSPENESESTFWVLEIDRALSACSREDTQSIGDSRDASATSTRNTADTESIGSEGSGGSSFDVNGLQVWRGKNAVGRALQPPVVERRNLFALYSDLDPLPSPKGQPCSLLAKVTASSVARTLLDSTREPTSPTTETSPLRIQIDFKSLNCKIPFSSTQVEQFEPFFIKIFLFDIANCCRLTEEFHVTLIPKSLEKYYRDGINSKSTPLTSPTTPNNPNLINNIPYSILMNPEASTALCALTSPTQDIYIIAKIERLLSDCSSDIYGKSQIDSKTGLKLQKNAILSCQKLAKYRTLFGWSASPLF
uniref:PH domain-containing protein n=1 Tax=Panagrolaimus superbus TaxID=310955 RepID=A0A914Z3E9_9BILA